MPSAALEDCESVAQSLRAIRPRDPGIANAVRQASALGTITVAPSDVLCVLKIPPMPVRPHAFVLPPLDARRSVLRWHRN
jgi:hypothetical protein